MRRFPTHILLISLGVIFAITLLEGVIFRFILLPSDMPALEFRNGLIKYKPNQTGVYRVKNEIAAAYRINAQGWNSSHAAYTRSSGAEPLIAVIGDSYVEALQVEVTEAFPEQLERLLGPPFRVYRMGISGAPLSQYLEILRKEVIPLNPKIVVINLVHNDFDESFRFKPGFYTSSFLKIDISSGTPTELAPTEFVKPWYSAVRNSASWRYMVNRNGLRLSFIRDSLLGKPTLELHKTQMVAPPTIDTQTTHEVTSYLIDAIRSATQAIGAQLLIVIDGDRQLIYQGSPVDSASDSDPSALNRMMRDITEGLAIPFLDLHPAFANDYITQGEKFNFESDFHWNLHGHTVATQAIFPVLHSLLRGDASSRSQKVR